MEHVLEFLNRAMDERAENITQHLTVETFDLGLL